MKAEHKEIKLISLLPDHKENKRRHKLPVKNERVDITTDLQLLAGTYRTF